MQTQNELSSFRIDWFEHRWKQDDLANASIAICFQVTQFYDEDYLHLQILPIVRGSSIPMDAILEELERKDTRKATNQPDFSRDDVASALRRFIEALEEALPLLADEETKEDSSRHDDVAIDWLLALVSQIPSELGPHQLARAVWDASHISDEGRKQEALFTALGASDEAMKILFEVAPYLSQIKEKISLADLGLMDHEPSSPEIIDEAEHLRRRLRQEALDAAQVAAIAQAEADALTQPSRFGSTHTITRSSDLEAQKLAKKAAKHATQAMQRARAAGAMIDESDLLAVDGSVMGEGGLMGRSQDELQAIQQSLLPEGSRVHYHDQGLPTGTEREEYDEYEKVTVPPPNLAEADLHPRLRIQDVLDIDCAIAFDGVSTLNPMQSAVFDTAFNRRENMLVCAPTGAGKVSLPRSFTQTRYREKMLVFGLMLISLLDECGIVDFDRPFPRCGSNRTREQELIGGWDEGGLHSTNESSSTGSRGKVLCQVEAAWLDC